MPATTFSFAEVVQRLEGLRRRLNSFALVRAVSLAGTVLLATLAALLLLAPRSSGATFGAATWTGLTLTLAAAAAAGLDLRRRWLDLAATARVVDRRGALAERLTTLLATRDNRQRSRLVPVLLAQTLERGDRWNAYHIAPRRFPRSAYALLAALGALLFAAVPLFEARSTTPRASELGNDNFTQGTRADAYAAATDATGSTLAGEPVGEPRGEISDTSASALAGEAGAANPPAGAPVSEDVDAGNSSAPAAEPASAGLLASLPERLQRLLSGKPPQGDDPGHSAGDRPGHNGKPNDERLTNARKMQAEAKRDASFKEENTSGQPAHSENARKTDQPNRQADASKTDGENSAQASFKGAAPPAGGGSRPGGLLGNGAADSLADLAAPEPFEIKLTSFLAAGAKSAKPRREKEKETEAGGPADPGHDPVPALNPRQAADDILRRAQIPPEYEAIFRRIYLAGANR